jgi:hypothetical protein
VNTTVITVVLLQNCIDLLSGECASHSGMCATFSEVGNEVIHVHLGGITKVTEGEYHEAMMSPLIRTDPGVGIMSSVSSLPHKYLQLPVSI